MTAPRSSRRFRSQLRRMAVVANEKELDLLLAPLIADPRHTAILSDHDGTLKPIASPSHQRMLPGTRPLLRRLQVQCALVGAISGRKARNLRSEWGLPGVQYVGLHGGERLVLDTNTLERVPGLTAWTPKLERFSNAVYNDKVRALGVAMHRKGPVTDFSWRNAPDQVAGAAAVATIAQQAVRAGLVVQPAKMSLEVKPPVPFDKGMAITRLLEEHPEILHVLYAGDDYTDVDGFKALAAALASGRLRSAVRIGVHHGDVPVEVLHNSDALVDGVAGMQKILRKLAGPTPVQTVAL